MVRLYISPSTCSCIAMNSNMMLCTFVIAVMNNTAYDNTCCHPEQVGYALGSYNPHGYVREQTMNQVGIQPINAGYRHSTHPRLQNIGHN